MKYIAILLFVVLCALPVCGDSIVKDKLSLSISTMQINNTYADEYLGSPIGFNLGYKLSQEGNKETGISIGYFTAEHEAEEYNYLDSMGVRNGYLPWFDYTMRTIPVMLTERWTFKQDSKFQPYIGYGFGFSWTQQEATWSDDYYPVGMGVKASDEYSESVTRITGAYQFMAGAKFGSGFFIDAKYISGGEDINSGLVLSLGKSF